MSRDLPHYALRIMFRSQHSALWEIADKAGILGELGLSIDYLEFSVNSRKAEDALFSGEVDFIAGNHITPYRWVAQGRPIVCITSPGNAVRDSVIAREPVSSLAEFKEKGLRVGDANLIDPWGGIYHPRGNHILDVLRAGYEQGEAEWIECGQIETPELMPNLIEAVKSGRADVAFGWMRDGETIRKEGLHVVQLPTLPMVNGTTITTTYETIGQKEQLAERLVKAQILAIHYARMHPEEAQKLLDSRLDKPYTQHGGRAAGVSRYPMKPYPTTQGVANAYELCCMQYEETKSVSPFALWDMHYLRALDVSGFIDELIQEQPESARNPGGEGVSSM